MCDGETNDLNQHGDACERYVLFVDRQSRKRMEWIKDLYRDTRCGSFSCSRTPTFYILRTGTSHFLARDRAADEQEHETNERGTPTAPSSYSSFQIFIVHAREERKK